MDPVDDSNFAGLSTAIHSERKSAVKIGVVREVTPRERRVALVPDAVRGIVQDGAQILVEENAGQGAFFSDAVYRKAGAEVRSHAHEVYADSDIVVKVEKPTTEELSLLREGSALVSFLYPQLNLELIGEFARRKITSFSMDAVPRITRAQSMDALSSMSTIAGYKAVLQGASAFGRLFPMLVTAAGTLAPARVLVLGAGVAGLQAIATARRLGAVVEAFDVRPVVKEQVESLGAKFVEPPEFGAQTEDSGGYARELGDEEKRRNMATIANVISSADIVISTALIPGKPAPTLITEEMVRTMKDGSVVVDIAAEMGGNCALTKAGEETIQHGVIVIGPLNLPSTAATHASQMYSKNVGNFLTHLLNDGRLTVDLEDPITSAMCVTHEGEIVNEAAKKLIEQGTISSGGTA